LAKGGFAIGIRQPAKKELEQLRIFDQRKIADAIRNHLSHEPLVPSRNRKELIGVNAEFEHDPPLWELRIGEYRVFYDVDEQNRIVRVRAIRHKPPQAATEDVIR
jgi:mRNA-degrading endonuclease RelE of RelBE toxin-antitoxin system